MEVGEKWRIKVFMGTAPSTPSPSQEDQGLIFGGEDAIANANLIVASARRAASLATTFSHATTPSVAANYVARFPT